MPSDSTTVSNPTTAVAAWAITNPDGLLRTFDSLFIILPDGYGMTEEKVLNAHFYMPRRAQRKGFRAIKVIVTLQDCRPERNGDA
jgi:hypothetical protein